MADPVGVWNINVIGYKGTLNITSNGAGSLSGTVDIDIGFTDRLQGTWNEATKEIRFDRIISRGGSIIVQKYTGYLYLTKEPIFAGQGPPEPNPSFRLLTGFFESDPASNPPRGGWVARQRI
uniref:Uncharacterized protein n=1 Tax=Thermosporothrix sp. COM3 TaxID=2490863 RepID=A0A455SJ82_9CHLR|nr:hypothetical protein KTC_21690 [Thermosporothrix sp. COM3]